VAFRSKSEAEAVFVINDSVGSTLNPFASQSVGVPRYRLMSRVDGYFNARRYRIESLGHGHRIVTGRDQRLRELGLSAARCNYCCS